jgi:hypothetical protein
MVNETHLQTMNETVQRCRPRDNGSNEINPGTEVTALNRFQRPYSRKADLRFLARWRRNRGSGRRAGAGLLRISAYEGRLRW